MMATLTLFEIRKFSCFVFSNKKKNEERFGIFKNILFVKMKIPKLITYSTYMCQSYQGIMVCDKLLVFFMLGSSHFVLLIFCV
jgi:hypothetical protein